MGRRRAVVTGLLAGGPNNPPNSGIAAFCAGVCRVALTTRRGLGELGFAVATGCGLDAPGEVLVGALILACALGAGFLWEVALAFGAGFSGLVSTLGITGVFDSGAASGVGVTAADSCAGVSAVGCAWATSG